jgi:hypothetical protein
VKRLNTYGLLLQPSKFGQPDLSVIKCQELICINGKMLMPHEGCLMILNQFLPYIFGITHRHEKISMINLSEVDKIHPFQPQIRQKMKHFNLPISAIKSRAIFPGSVLDKNGFVKNDKFTGKDHNPYFHR